MQLNVRMLPLISDASIFLTSTACKGLNVSSANELLFPHAWFNILALVPFRRAASVSLVFTTGCL